MVFWWIFMGWGLDKEIRIGKSETAELCRRWSRSGWSSRYLHARDEMTLGRASWDLYVTFTRDPVVFGITDVMSLLWCESAVKDSSHKSKSTFTCNYTKDQTYDRLGNNAVGNRWSHHSSYCIPVKTGREIFLPVISSSHECSCQTNGYDATKLLEERLSPVD